MDAEEFEATYAHPSSAPDEEFEDGGEELLMHQDILDGISLLTRVKCMLDYMSDVELCKTITKRERLVMLKISGQVGSYLDSVSSNYEEETGTA